MSAFLDRLSAREPATALALLRVGLALGLLLGLLDMLRAGNMLLLWVDRTRGGYRPLKAEHPVVELLAGPTEATLYILVGTALLGGLLLLLGFGSRLTPLVLLAVTTALHSLNPDTVGPLDHLLPAGLLLLVLAPASTTLSLDARLARGVWRSTEPRPGWVRPLAVAQLLLALATTGTPQHLAAAVVLGAGLLLQRRLDLRPVGAALLLLACAWDAVGPLPVPGALLPLSYLPACWSGEAWDRALDRALPRRSAA